MNVTCVALESGGGMRPQSEASALEGWRAGRGPYWIHLAGGSPEVLDAWFSNLGLDSSLLELLNVGDAQTRIVPLVDAVLVVYPVPGSGDAGGPARFGCLCLDRLVVTMHPDPDRSSLVEGAPVTRLRLREGSTAAVLTALIVVQSGRVRRQIVALRAEADKLDERMDADAWAVPIGEILAFKRRVLAMGGLVDEELAVFEVLRASNLEVLPLARFADPLQVASQVTRTTERDVDRLDRRAVDLHRRHESAEQDRLNQRLGLLTVISAIFMPLTLIAGIYGMNFESMPELHLRYGYPLTLAAMALLAAGLTWYFRTRWWGK